MAKAIIYREVGGPDVLHLEDVPDEVPGEEEVVVAVRAAGVNPIDWKYRAGIRGGGTDGQPRGLGSDAAGIIEVVGEGVDDFAVGDEVIVRRARWAYATQVRAAVGQLVRKPEALGWEEAASIGVPVGTAYQVLRSLGVGTSDTLLLHGGSGAVGQATIQLARADGATVIATAREANHDRIRHLGAIPVAYGAGLEARARSLTPEGVTVALDAVGTDEAIDVSLALVSDRDRIGTIVRGRDAATWGIRAWSGGSPVPLTDEEQRWRDEATPLIARLAAEGRFELEIGARFPLADAAEAHRASEAGTVRGKIVLLV